MKLFVGAASIGLCIMGCAAQDSSEDDAEDFAASGDEAITRQNDPACNLPVFYAANSSQKVQRALDWVGRKVMYSKGVTRASSPYRADCSGLVSMAWELAAPGDSSDTFWGGPSWSQTSYGVSWETIRAGDALNYSGKGKAGHVMLFAGWLDESHREFCAIEEFAPGKPAMVVRHGLGDPSSAWGNGPRGKSIGDMYLPIRKAGE